MAQADLLRCRYPQALVNMKKALSFDPKSSIINHAIGVVYFFMKKYHLAESHFKTAIQLQDSYTEAQVSLVFVLMKKKKWNEALNYLKIIEKDLTYSHHAKTYFLMGQIYYEQKKYDLSKKYLLSSISISKDHCLSFAYLGRIYYDHEQYEQALVQFDKSQKCEEKQNKTPEKSCEKLNVDHYYFHAVVQLRAGHIQSGLKNLKLFIDHTEMGNRYLSSARQLLKRYNIQ